MRATIFCQTPRPPTPGAITEMTPLSSHRSRSHPRQVRQPPPPTLPGCCVMAWAPVLVTPVREEWRAKGVTYPEPATRLTIFGLAAGTAARRLGDARQDTGVVQVNEGMRATDCLFLSKKMSRVTKWMVRVLLMRAHTRSASGPPSRRKLQPPH